MFDPPFPRELLDVLGQPPAYPSGIDLLNAWQWIEGLPGHEGLHWQNGAAQKVLLNSLTRLMEHRAVVLAGVPGPVDLDMAYREIRFKDLARFQIDPNRNMAISTTGGRTFYDLRVFLPEQWAAVHARGGRLPDDEQDFPAAVIESCGAGPALGPTAKAELPRPERISRAECERRYIAYVGARVAEGAVPSGYADTVARELEGISRAVLRQLRSKFAPEAWSVTKPGRKRNKPR